MSIFNRFANTRNGYISSVPFAPGNRWLSGLQPCYDDAEGGGDGGVGDGDAGAGGGEGGAGGDGGVAAAAAKFISVKGDQLVQFEGMDKPMKLADWQKQYAATHRGEGTTSAVAAITKLIKEAGGGVRQPTKPGQKPAAQQQQQQEEDLLAAFQGDGFVENKALADVLKRIDTQRLTPMTKVVIKLAETVKNLQGQLMGIHTNNAESGFNVDLDKVVGSLKLPAMEGENPHGPVQEMARDFFFSFDDADHAKLQAGEFGKLFNERFKQLRTYFKALDKAELKAAQDRQRQMRFVKPGANGSGNGKPKPLTNEQIGDALFANSR